MTFDFSKLRPLPLLQVLAIVSCVLAEARAAEQEPWNAKVQATYIWQHKDAFTAAYSGAHSLSADEEKSYSFTTTAALGMRLWDGGEFYFNPEVAQGVPLSNLTGLGGMTNGEMARTSGARPTLYRARLFMRQVWGFGGGQQEVESAPNQLAGMLDKRRLTLTAGNVSVIDLFDANAYSHDPRTQFINWSIMTHGAYDFAADSRGYTWGLALEVVDDAWAVRFGRFLQPLESNGLALDTRIFHHYGDQLELEHTHRLGEHEGKVRLLAFRNVATMGAYSDALALSAASGTPPAVADVRARHQKLGMGIGVEQALSHDAGLFARASWADGKTETYAFAEIDRSISAGVLMTGERWSRPADNVGLAIVRNGISSLHRDYLAAGGLGFFVGDGRLNYRPELITEVFYEFAVARHARIGVNWQRIENPAYNRDRGPVNVASIRLHADF